MLKLSILIFALFFLPLFAFSEGSVVINEIGWAGTKADDTDEWIELRNNTSSAVDLNGWVLKAPSDGRPTINLSGSITGGAFYLIERTADSDILDIPADYFGTFGQYGNISNTGEDLELLDASGGIIDKLTFSAGWPAGTAGPDYVSMERIDPMKDGSLASNWASNNGLKINGKDAAGNNILGTPKSENSVYVSGSSNILPPTPPTTSSSQEKPATLEISESSSPPLQASSAPPETFKVYAGDDKTVLSGQEVVFSGKVTDLKGNIIQNHDFLWNFGDGATSRQKVSSHTFSFPGKYIVSLNVSIVEESHADYLNVEVLAPKIIISEARPGQDGFIELLNETGQKLDIGGLVIKDGLGGVFSIPKSTILAQNALLVFPNAVTQIFTKLSDLILATSNGKIIDKAHFEVIADTAQSFVREGDKFVVSLNPSPGTVNSKITSDVVKLATSDVALVEKKAVVKNTETVKIAEKPKELEIPPPALSSTALAEQISPVEQPVLTVQAADRGKFAVNSKIFLGASVLAGILGAAGFLAMRLLGRF